MHRGLIIFVLMSLIFTGCESKTEETVAVPKKQPASKIETAQLFSEPVATTLVETATAALPVWRKSQQNPPTLVILSNNPFLQAIPTPLQEKADQLVLSADAVEIDKKAVYKSADPTLMPSMAVSAALQAGLFAKVVWVLPISSEKPMATADAIRSQLLAAGDISTEEAATFIQEETNISSLIRNTPWTICRLNSLPSVNEPVVAHFDLSFFRALFENEISTPLYKLVADVALKVREKQWQGSAATVSLSNITGEISLKTRFLGQDIVTLLTKPELLDAETMPELWLQRSQALYLDNLFQQEKIRDIYLELEKHFPSSASIKFGLFEIFGQMKEADKAMRFLDEAVALDKIYALEYLNLSERAFNKSDINASMNMLNKASDTFPDDPFIKLKKVGLYRQTGGIGLASDLITELQKLAWSEVYDPDMPEFLATLAMEAAQAQKEAVHNE